MRYIERRSAAIDSVLLKLFHPERIIRGCKTIDTVAVASVKFFRHRTKKFHTIQIVFLSLMISSFLIVDLFVVIKLFRTYTNH